VLEDANVAQGDEGVFTQLDSASPQGFVTMVDTVGDDGQLESWLLDLAARLERDGFTGTLQGTTQAKFPDWFITGIRTVTDDNWPVWTPLPPEPTAFVAWSFDLAAMTTGSGRGRWCVPPEATAALPITRRDTMVRKERP
jgi:hypothetical protein